MAISVKKIIREHFELRQRIRVLEEVKGFLEKCKARGNDEPINVIRMEDGSAVDNEVILNELSEIDDIVATTQRRISELEDMEVSDGKKVAGKAPRRSRGSKASDRKGSKRAGKSASKDDNKGGGS